MSKQIFINLPVADLFRSIDFFSAVGFSYNPRFSGDGAACFVVSDTISIMLATHETFRRFTPRDVCDTSKAVEVLLSLGCESRQEVDDIVARALEAGGTTYDEPEDLGFMYSHSFIDLDGHGWGVLYLTSEPEG